MEDIIVRCHVFSRRGWTSTFLFASDWTFNPTDWSNYKKFMSYCNYKVKGKTGFMCSCIQSLDSQHHNPKSHRRESVLFWKHKENSWNWVPVGPEHSVLAICSFQSELLVTERKNALCLKGSWRLLTKPKVRKEWSLNKNKGTVITRRASGS